MEPAQEEEEGSQGRSVPGAGRSGGGEEPSSPGGAGEEERRG